MAITLNEIRSLAQTMHYLEMDINQNAEGDKLWLEKQDKDTQKEWEQSAQEILKLLDKFSAR